MDNSYVNFIAYEGQDFFPKIEMGLEDSPSFQNSLDRVSNDYMFSLDNDSQKIFCNNQNTQNLFQSIFDVALSPNTSLISYEKPQKQAPFQIIRKQRDPKKEEFSTCDETSVILPIADKIASKSRRIIKREKAKQRNSVKSVTSMPSAVSSEMSQKNISDALNDSNLDEKSKKKMLQMIRNRISAQNSRDRKKAYIKKLETQQKKVVSENMHLQKQVRLLKQANGDLKLQCEQLKRGLMMCMNEAYEKFNQNQRNLDDECLNLNLKNDIDAMIESSYDSYSKKNENAPNQMNMSKYSLALATLFAVLMFSNVNLQNAIPDFQKLQIGQVNTFETQLEEAASLDKRKIEDISIKTPETFNESNIKIEMEQESLQRNDSWQSFSNSSSVDELKSLRDTFNEKYMSEFLSQLKVGASPDLESLSQDVKFAQYITQNRVKHTNARLSQDKTLTPENSTALFCPSGFIIESAEEKFFGAQNEFSVKLEDNSCVDSKKNMKLNKAQWLQLFVPKNNLHFASLTGNQKFKVSNDSGCENKDSSLIELWCKVVDVKTLEAGF